MTSLAEQIAQLTNPAPNFKDPEDGIDDETSAKVVSSYAPSDFYETSEVSRLRKKVIPLLADTDVKYAGRRISRQNLQNDSIDSENGDDYSSESEGTVDSDFERKDSEFEDSDLETFKVKLTGKTAEQGKSSRAQSTESLNAYEEDSEDLSDEEIDNDVEEEDEDDKYDVDEEIEEDDLKHNHSVDQEVDEEGKDDLQNFSKSDLEEEKAKGVATRTQLSLWDSLLEGRIKVQKALILANQLPQPDTWSAFSEGQGFVKSSAEVQAALSQLENAFAELQTILLKQNPETKNLLEDSLEKTPKSLNDDEDEEITSESEMEDDEDDTRHKKQTKSPDVSQKRKIEMDEFPDFLAKRHKAFHLYRNNIIQKWNDKTKLAAGKVSSKSFSAFEQTALKQIEQILSDKERLLKRTQLKRTTYNVLGKEKKEEESTEALDQLPNRDHLKDYDEQIFDDDDFYHQLLRELIERKSSDLTDPVAISRQWLEIQKLRSKSKKKVDTKASKGRKIRYNTLNKLVNFMAPHDTTTWTDESKDDLFTSLFGKRFQGTADNPVTKS